MDCEKFDRVLMDVLYKELDELTEAAAIRHSDQCQRCRELLGDLKTTRETVSLPLTEPPDGFESRIMDAERQLHRRLPWRQRFARGVTILSGYAMRPQLAMAAILLLMIGGSLILLRPKPGSHASVTVTESGVPQKEESVVVAVEEPEPTEAAADEMLEPAAAPLKREAADGDTKDAVGDNRLGDSESAEAELDVARSKAEDEAFDVAMNSYRSGQLLTAQKQFDEIVQANGKHAAQSELLAAQATEKALGCSEALARFDSVAANRPAEFRQTAIWHSANCRKQLGRTKRAMLDFEKLLEVPAYAEQARQALAELQASGEQGPVLAESQKNESKTTTTKQADQKQATGLQAQMAKRKRASKPKPSKAEQDEKAAKQRKKSSPTNAATK